MSQSHQRPPSSQTLKLPEASVALLLYSEHCFAVPHSLILFRQGILTRLLRTSPALSANPFQSRVSGPSRRTFAGAAGKLCPFDRSSLLAAMATAAPSLPTRFPCWCKAIYSWGGEVRSSSALKEHSSNDTDRVLLHRLGVILDFSRGI